MDSTLVALPSSLGFRDYPHIFQPPKSNPVDRGGFATVAPGQTLGILADQSNYIFIPTQQEGWITQFAVFMGSYGDGQNWSLTESGIAIRDYNGRTAALGAVETPVIRAIPLKPSQPYVLTFTNPAVSPRTGGPNPPLSVQWSMYGYYYPKRTR